MWTGGYATRLSDARGHEVIVDLPADEGGADFGTSALELAVQSLAGCISTIFALVAAKRRVPYESLSIELTASRPKGAPTIERVRATVRVSTPATHDEVETALRLTVRTCPVGVIFERAGIPIDVDLIVRPGRSKTPTPSLPDESPATH